MTQGATQGWQTRAVEWTPFLIAGGLIFAMMAGVEALLYGVAAAGGIGSFMLGRNALPDARHKFGKSWLFVIGLTALSLIDGKWEPMLFFTLAAAISTALFWFPSRSSH